LVPFWTHTNALMGARFLTKSHIALLGFAPVSRNRHFASVFKMEVGSSLPAHKLGGMKDHESNTLRDSSESKKLSEGLSSVYPSSHG
jgi:hypothetical protein